MTRYEDVVYDNVNGVRGCSRGSGRQMETLVATRVYWRLKTPNVVAQSLTSPDLIPVSILRYLLSWLAILSSNITILAMLGDYPGSLPPRLQVCFTDPDEQHWTPTDPYSLNVLGPVQTLGTFVTYSC